MFDFHKDKQVYFDIQKEVTRDYIIPFLKTTGINDKQINVLEIGCAEAGVLKVFLENGHKALGIELNESRAKLARQFLGKEIHEQRVQIINKNMYDFNPDNLNEKFDLIILKDVIEHIPQQEKFIPFLKKFINPKGIIFFAFPPWHMPFGGHQQICQNKWLSRMPWIHLLPAGIYAFILKRFGEQDNVVKELLEIKETGITIDRFHKILRASGLKLIKQQSWLFNPIYKWKFSLTPVKLPLLLAKIPFLRNLYTTAYYAAITSEK